MNGKKIYFASDLHLGIATSTPSIEREKLFVRWLEMARHDASEIFLLGDIFDFWHEYRYVIPKGFSRFQGAIASITDSGIPVHFFTGNHDLWMYGYLAQELGVSIHTQPLVTELYGKKFFLGHGDGLGSGDTGYKLMKRAFSSPSLQWLFARLHPNFAMWIGTKWSTSSRYSKAITHVFRGEEELITRFVRKHATIDPAHFYIFGHWHSPVVYPLNEQCTLVLLGDWVENYTYGVWDAERFSLFRYHSDGSVERVREG